MSETLSQTDTYQVIEAIDSALQDSEALYGIASRLGAAGDDEDQRIAYEDYLRLRSEQIDPRIRYALGYIAGKDFNTIDVASAMREYAAGESATKDDTARSGRLGRTYRLIVQALNDPASVQKTPIYSHADLPSPEVVREAPSHKFTYIKYTPDRQDPSKHWLSLSDRRTLVESSSGGGVVASYPIITSRPHQSGGLEILWSSENGRREKLSGTPEKFRENLTDTAIAGMSVPTWTIELSNGDKEVRYVASVTETGEDNISVHYFNSRHKLQSLHLADGSDTYRVTGGNLQIFVPDGRTSFSEYLEIDTLDEVLDEFIAGDDVAEVALQASGQTQRPIYDTFRPINTGRPGTPQVNPRPLSVGKQN